MLRQNGKQCYYLIMKFDVNKKFVKLGRSWGMIIPPWFLQVLNIDPNSDEVKLSIDGKKIIIEKK